MAEAELDGLLRCGIRVCSLVVHLVLGTSFFERGRCEYMRQAGMSYAEVEAAGYHLPVVDAQVSYRQPARYDDEIFIETKVVERRRVRMTFEYRVLREDESGETLLATGRTTHACITHEGKPVRFPAEVDALMNAHGDLG